jgi:glycine betaine/proline transport system ATP-binding protein
VQNPATDYVADFTRHVARAKVVRAQSRMEPATADHFAGEVAYDATIESIADEVERADAPMKVMKDGKVIGQITSRTVIDVLVGRG